MGVSSRTVELLTEIDYGMVGNRAASSQKKAEGGPGMFIIIDIDLDSEVYLLGFQLCSVLSSILILAENPDRRVLGFEEGALSLL